MRGKKRIILSLLKYTKIHAAKLQTHIVQITPNYDCHI